METVTLTIDGRQVTVEKGKTVLQAAIESGISVPYYCYHPGIGIDGSCRVCIVKIEKMPKLQTSCSTACAEGMVVSTRTPDVVEARAGVFEFLLVNHPLDCPVCDKGGECPLQDFSYQFGPDQSRMDFPRRVFDGEGVQGRRRLRADADAEPQPLHPVHALRPVHARHRQRRADQHHRSRQRQRDRDVPGRGRALAALRQPDGRLPGRRDHDARLPLQVAAVGQPVRGRHDLHAVREGLQHHRVDQGEAGVGQGIAADPLHAALQPRRQRLLDVRHRPLRLPLDRRRRSPASSRWCGRGERAAAGVVARRDGDAVAIGSAAAGTANADGVRFLLSAHASHEELFLFRRLDRGAARRRRRRRRSASRWRVSREAAAGRREVQGAGGRRAERQRRADARARRRQRRATRRAKPDISRAARRRSRPAAWRRSTCSIPGPDGSLGDTAWIVEARKSGAIGAARSCRACC